MANSTAFGPSLASLGARRRFEWRVRWRRTGWSTNSHTKSRAFTRRSDAEAFVAKLRSDGRPDLSRVEYVQLDERVVGAWREMTR